VEALWLRLVLLAIAVSVTVHVAKLPRFETAAGTLEVRG
jgi:hypothetical protein